MLKIWPIPHPEYIKIRPIRSLKRADRANLGSAHNLNLGPYNKIAGRTKIIAFKIQLVNQIGLKRNDP